MPVGPLFATPAYGAFVTAPHFRSCLKLSQALWAGGLPNDWLVAWNESLITRGRNVMAAAFLKSDWSHLFWLDSDIDFEPEDIAKVWNLGADVGVGFYTMKRPDKPLSAWKDGKLLRIEDCPKEPFEVDLAGTGCMCIKREVLETVAKTCEVAQGEDGPYAAMFMDPIHKGVQESEDYFFCRKAREAGFKIIGDPTVKLGHWGLHRFD